MSLEITPEAAAVLRRSLDIANIDAASRGGVRLRAAKALGGGVEIQVELADGPGEAETVLEQEGLNVYVDSSVTELYVDAIVALEPQHETIVVRPREAP